MIFFPRLYILAEIEKTEHCSGFGKGCPPVSKKTPILRASI